MMPTFPRSSLSFRTAGFPQYGWKAGFPSGAFLDRQQLKPCSRHAPSVDQFASALRAPRSRSDCPALCRAADSIAHRLGGSLLLRPRGPRSGPGCSVPVRHHLIDPIRPTRGHTAISPHGGLYAMPSLCGAPRRPRVVPGFRRSFPPDMPPSLTPGSSIVVSVQYIDVDIGLRHGPKGSALPMIPQSVSRGARISGLLWFATATACQVAGPPVRI
jgi:hypothetical protein